MDTPFDCQACGACCLSPWDGAGYVRLDQDESERLAAAGLPVIVEQQPGWEGEPESLLRLATVPNRGGRLACAAFQGGVGRHCSCGIYDIRPNACRRFEAGSVLCRAARRRLGLSA